MPGQKRINNQNLEHMASKRVKRPDGERRHPVINGLINEQSVTNVISNERCSLESSFVHSPLAVDRSARVSLSSRQHRKSLVSFAPREASKNDVTETREEIPPAPLTALDYSNNLKSLHEIISKSFDPKRAFSYNFINIMNSFIKSEKGLVDFKLIALSLEAGTRVYTSKVDVVYRNTQKVSSSLSMATTDEKNIDEEFDALFGDDNFNQTIEKKKRKRHKKTVSTIVSNPETINGKYETNIEIDPLFHHLSAAFDVGNVNSLLMANLTPDPFAMLLLNSDASLCFSSIDQPSSVAMSSSWLMDQQTSTALFEDNVSNICNGYRDFEFLHRDEELEQPTPMQIPSSQLSSQIPMNEPSDFYLDLNGDIMDVDNDVDNIDFDDPFDHSHSNDSEEINETEKNKENEDNRLVADLTFDSEKLMKILPENDNQFFNTNFLKSVFRKVSNLSRARTNANTADGKKTKNKRARVSHQPLDFELTSLPEEIIADQSKITFKNETLATWTTKSCKNFQLKHDYGFNSTALKACFAKSNTYFNDLLSVRIRNHAELAANGAKAIEGDNDHHKDDGDCSLFGEDGVPHEDDFTVEPFNPEIPFEPATEDNRIDDEPRHVDALDIDYAKVAKKINIKVVKKGMWDIIQKEATTTQPILPSQESTLPSSQESQSSQTKPLTFCDLRQNLPLYINSNLNDNLSVPISFVALLHLCNEKTLALTAQDQLDDFLITPQS